MKKTIIQTSILALLATAVFTAESCRKEDPPAKTITTPNSNTGGTGTTGNGTGSSGTGGSGTGGSGNTITGCLDQDSPNYNSNATSSDGSCQYVYISNYEITYYPQQDNGSDWDFGFGSTTNADLKLVIEETSTTNAIFTSSTMDNQVYNTPAVWTESNSIKLKNMNYSWTLVDVDSGSPDDPISSGTFTFSPSTASVSTTIIALGTNVNGDASQLKITYSIY